LKLERGKIGMDGLACPLDPDGWLPHDVYRQLTALLPEMEASSAYSAAACRRVLATRFPQPHWSALKFWRAISPHDRDVHFTWRRRLSAWRLRLTAGILRPTPRKRRMVSMNLGAEIGFDK
jgi:hypothetical protein